MANPVVHFEIIGKDASALREFYKQLFGWDAEIDPNVAPAVSQAENYGFIQNATNDGQAVPGGIGGGPGFTPHTVFYVGVDNVSAYLDKAESLGGKKVLGPVEKRDGSLVIGHFADPEGNVVGLAGPSA